ncbi:MAG TPA: helix-turn-helix transcriptional regulator [Thermoanaerobaculia bacterium]|nr:helix-turn-helix transcriptional regulator [Thermoanaerobaculia bacterium]
MAKQNRTPLNLALELLRRMRGWTQGELAQAAGISSNVLSGYESGFRHLSRHRLEKLAASMGYDVDVVDTALIFTEAIHSVVVPPDSPSLVEPSMAERQSIARIVATVAHRTMQEVHDQLFRTLRDERVETHRREAGELWEELRRLPARDRMARVEAKPRFQTWALCERLCAESASAAGDHAGRALELAELALRVATLIPGLEAWRSRVQGYAWAFVGNARRVGSRLDAAEEAFERARELWQAGGNAEAGVLDETRVLDLEASLRRDQRRLPEALALLDRALEVSVGDDAAERILLKKASTQEQMGNHEAAIATLQAAALLVDEEREPRRLFALRFNLAVNLEHLDRHAEAEALLPEVRDLAVRMGNALDLVRVVWLEGRVAAGSGRREDAVLAFEQAQRDFTAREIAYDAALVSLDLAILHLEDGRTREVRSLARQMMWIFTSQKIHREALAALRLFCEAAEREQATVALARRVAEYLEKARHDPELRFEA